jgi:hypothetical protein
MATLTPILLGGLGNRLYQIANGFKLQKEYGFDLKFHRLNQQIIDIKNYRTFVVRSADFDDFGGHNLIIKDNLPKTIDQLFSKLYFESTPMSLDEVIYNKNMYFEGKIINIDNTKDSAIMGYFFTYKDIIDEIELVKKSIDDSVIKYIDEKYIELSTKKILGIHLRLGINTDNFGAVSVPPSFYENILHIEKNNYDLIYIVSDNIYLAKSYVEIFNLDVEKIRFIENEPMFVDLMILSKCSTLVIGNSTLSAWSGFFNKNNNIYLPGVWIRHHGTNDLPKEWKIF